jgi:hypothetical protein
MDMPMAPTANHGFSLLGDSSLVLSHIPMFMAPHQYQIFLEVTIEGPAGTDPVQAYLEDKKTSKTTDYELVSDPIVLPTLAEDGAKRLTQFTGKLYRGWPFNNPNTAPVIVPALTVHVKRVLYFHSILNQQLLTELTYFAFHTHETGYLIHKLVQPADLKTAPTPPDFVQILSGKLESEKFADVVEVGFPGVANDLNHRLNAGQSANGVVGGKHEHVHVSAELVYDPNHLL